MARKILDCASETFVRRPTVALSLPLGARVAIKRPEQVILLLDEHSMDIGALCYLRRSNASRQSGRRLYPCSVDLSSLSIERSSDITKLIRFLSDRLSVAGYRPSSVTGNFSSMRSYLQWCDGNNHFGALSGSALTYAAFKGYVDYLQECIDNHTMRRSTAWERQRSVEKILRDLLQVHDIRRGVNVITSPRGDEVPTEPPDEADLAKTSGLCDALFHGLTDFVLGELPYPHRLMMPRFLKWEHDHLWLFPDQHWCVPPTFKERLDAMGRKTRNYDYVEGRLITFEEAVAIYGTADRARTEIKRSSGYLERANSDPRNYYRMRLAVKAQEAFITLFLAQTGLNASVARELPWNSKMFVGSAQQGFREIKWRAMGKEVSVVVRSRFLPFFRKYLELRSYILKKRTCDYLFFSLGPSLLDEPARMSPTITANLLYTLHRIDPSLQPLGARKLRAAKQDFHMSREEPAVAARLMGHSEETALRIYSAGTKSHQYAEISEFLGKLKDAALSRVVVARGDIVPGGQTGNLGLCTKFKAPAPIVETASIQPDCNRQEGCLFCDKYRVHADEIDVRKLASCAYVIERTTNTPSAEEYFAPVLERINDILSEISSRKGNDEMVSRIVHGVNVRGELTPYWEEKLALLAELEIAR